MRKILLGFFLLLFSTVSFSQKWQQYFDSAKILENNNDANALHYYLLAKNTLPPDSSHSNIYADIAYGIAYAYHNANRFAEAEPLYVEAKNIYEKNLGKTHHVYSSVSSSLAILYQNMGKYNMAQPLLLEIKDIQDKSSPIDSSAYGDACNNLGINYYYLEEYNKAEPLYRQSIAIKEKLLGKDSPEFANACNGLAILYKILGKYDEAETLFLQIKNIREKAFGKMNINYAAACINLAAFYKQTGRFTKSESLYLEAKGILEKTEGRSHPYYISTLNNLANTYTSTGQYEKSEQLLLEAKKLAEQTLGKDHPDYASYCNNLANLYDDMGEYEKAEPLYLEAKNTREKIFGREHTVYADACNNLAVYYLHTGQYNKAEPLYIEAKNIREKILGKLSVDYATSCNNLAVLYKDMELYDRSEPLFIEALNVLERTVGKDHPDYATTCSALGVLYYEQKKYEKAEPLYIEAKNTIEKVLGKQHPDYGESCNNLAVLYQDMGLYQKAEPLYEEAKDIRGNVFGKQHRKYAKSCDNLATLYWAENKTGKADSLFAEAFAIKYSGIQKILQYTSEKEKAAFIRNIAGTNNTYNSFRYQSFPHSKAAEPFTISFLSRNMILSSSQQVRKIIYSSNNANAIAVYENWALLKKQLAALYSKETNDAGIKILEDSANVLEKNIAKASGAFSELREQKNWKDIQNNLKENETAIEFVEFNYNNSRRWTDSVYYMALLLRKDRPEPVMVPLFEKKQLTDLLSQTGNKTSNDNVKTLYASRGAGEDDTVVLNRSLYKLIWGPLENELKGIKTIYFAPAGLLHRIAFAALPVNDKKVVSDEYRLIELNTTASIIDQRPYYISSSDKISLYGGIKYSVDTTLLKTAAYSLHTDKVQGKSLPSDLSRGGVWNELPGTKKETDEIISIIKQKASDVTFLSGVEATEESIKALDGKNSPVVLHIATHGFFFPDPQKEGNENSITNESGKAFKQSDDPLFRSGLLFAGANNSWTGKAIAGIEDGILTSYEVSTMYLPNTKLVVLSACETGLGDIQGAEGVYGLQRAFKMAGAEYLVMSLWKVPDEETAEFMQQFYKNMFTNQSIADAFYNAQTTMKNKYRGEPYKWAAWVLVR